MLTNGFYNLAEKGKKPPAVKVDAAFGGILLTFADGAGDELQVVLTAETVSDLFEKLMKLDSIRSGMERSVSAALADVLLNQKPA